MGNIQEKIAYSIRSYARRQGRMRPALQQALETHWELYGLVLPSDKKLDNAFSYFFPNKPAASKSIVEIGFGNGQSLLKMAKANPEEYFLGIELYKTGVSQLIRQLADEQLKNVRVMCEDAVKVFEQLPAGTLDRIQIFFPDPWPKKRHHKRRLIQPDFVQVLTQALTIGGVLHCATDWKEYAEHMAACLEGEKQLKNTVTSSQDSPYSPRPDYRPLTKFEKRGFGLGHKSYDLLYQRVS